MATEPWALFFQKLQALLDAQPFYLVKQVALTGSNQIVDAFAGTRGRAVWYFFRATNTGGGVVSGILGVSWDSSYTLPDKHWETNLESVGDTSDLVFSFAYASGRIRWMANCTATYRITAWRVLLP
jgi:hypothetical protein